MIRSHVKAIGGRGGMKMAPKREFLGKREGDREWLLGGGFGARGTTSPCHITGYHPHISHHTHTLVCPPVENYLYELHVLVLVQYVTDCYARNVLYHSAHARRQGLVSFFRC